ncbi:alpha/beta fold hydrolase [Crenalkalicoccus roseus]|uniref:alpha/beta fold hydrolase n=1 Tax=Crenalkalicoccus roseus TaxID=1485588 RepID=UPI001080B6D3|nr:alpha/beta fold hydrolase [Crenalkalicoccus roseus]
MLALLGGRAKGRERLVPLRSARRQAGPWRMHARIAAGAPPPGRVPVVMAQGLVISSLYFVPLLERLGRDFPAACPDLPGFGRSDAPERPLDTGGLADALAAWMRAEGMAPAALLGNSYGCQIAVECALRHPELVRALVLQGPTAPPELRESGPRLAARGLLDWAREWRTGLLDQLRTSPFRGRFTQNEMRRHRIEERILGVSVPVLVVGGSRDPIAPPGWCERLARAAPRGACRVIPGAAHQMISASALELARVARAFLLDLPPAAGGAAQGRAA